MYEKHSYIETLPYSFFPMKHSIQSAKHDSLSCSKSLCLASSVAPDNSRCP